MKCTCNESDCNEDCACELAGPSIVINKSGPDLLYIPTREDREACIIDGLVELVEVATADAKASNWHVPTDSPEIKEAFRWLQDLYPSLPSFEVMFKTMKLCLIHSEISEAMEGERKDLMDEKLPHRKCAEVELADAIIRIAHYAGAHGYDIAGAVVEKMEFNNTRPDHKLENRAKPGGKKF